MQFKQNFYPHYSLLQRHFELLWKRRCFWALSFHVNLPTRGNNTNNYVERSFGILKDIVFARIQAYNAVQMFQFLTTNMERFYTHCLLDFAHKRPNNLHIAKRFLYPTWETVNANLIQKTNINCEFLVASTKNSSFLYIVNSEIGVCSCPVGISSALCKHQGAVIMKFHISMFNVIPLLTPDDRMVYAYIALGK